MNLIDTNAYLGHFAARRLRYNTPEGLLALMDRAGIERACVSSASAICYRNCQAGNEEMWEALNGVLTGDCAQSLAPLPPLAAQAPGEGEQRQRLRGRDARGPSDGDGNGVLTGDCAQSLTALPRFAPERENNGVLTPTPLPRFAPERENNGDGVPPPRLVPFAVINPAYAAWETDLRWCREVMGARGVRIYPSWHGYRLSDPCCHDLAIACAELGMVISIPQRVEDYRQRHWLLDTPDVALNEMAALVAAQPETKFLITNAQGVGGSDLVTKKDDLPANYWVDVCRPDVIYTGEAERLVEALGAERIVFGSGIPFNYPEPALVRMEVLRDLGYDVEKIGSGNAEGLLGL